MKRWDYTSNDTPYIGLSTEPKETNGIEDGSMFLEVDTCNFFIFYGGQWWPMIRR